MIYTIYPTKDTTLYSHAANRDFNYGIDEVLELTKHISHSMISGEHSSRAVLNFTASDFPDTKFGSPSGSFLQIYCAHEQEISRDYTLIIGRGQDFTNGTGTYIRAPKAIDGANWSYSDNQTSTTWRSDFPNSASTHATESGQYYSSSKSPFALDTYSPDIYQECYQNVKHGTGSHNGLIAFSIHRGPQEDDGLSYGSLRFFSNESKTIFRPRIHLCYVDETTGGISTHVTSSNMKISSEGKYNMSEDGIERIYFHGFNAVNDTKSYSTSSKVSTRGAIANSGKASYQIRDAVSNTVYHQQNKAFTTLADDGNASMYIDIHTKSFIPEREYIVDVRIADRTFANQVEWYMDTHRFKTYQRGIIDYGV